MQRESEITDLKGAIGEEQTSQRDKIQALNGASKANHEQLETRHKEEKTVLTKKIETLEKSLGELR